MQIGMKVSVDGGITYNEAPEGVRVIYEKVSVNDAEEDGEVHVNLTHEGMITDVWASRGSSLDSNLGSRGETLEDLLGAVVKE